MNERIKRAIKLLEDMAIGFNIENDESRIKAIALLEACPDCKEPAEELSDDMFFGEKSKQSFLSREKKLKRNPKWPNSGWYNDEDFCNLYREACARLEEAEADSKEWMKKAIQRREEKFKDRLKNDEEIARLQEKLKKALDIATGYIGQNDCSAIAIQNEIEDIWHE